MHKAQLLMKLTKERYSCKHTTIWRIKIYSNTFLSSVCFICEPTPVIYLKRIEVIGHWMQLNQAVTSSFSDPPHIRTSKAIFDHPKQIPQSDLKEHGL